MSENQNEDLVWKTDGRDWGQGHRQYKATVAKGYYVAAPCYDWVSKELLGYEVYYYLSPGKQRYVGRDGSLDKAKVMAQADWDTGTANKRTPEKELLATSSFLTARFFASQSELSRRPGIVGRGWCRFRG